MNTFLSTSQVALFEDYKKFVASEIEPQVNELEGDVAVVKKIFEVLGQKGYLGIAIPKEYGGCGEPFINLTLFIQALGQLDAGLAVSVATHTAAAELISTAGTDTQKSRHLPLLARGECIGTIAFTEECAGSDYKALEALAKKAGEGFELTSEKTWVVNGEFADLAVVTAKMEGQDSISLFLAELKSASSLQISEDIKKLGLRSARTNNISFKAHKMDSSSLLGEDEKACREEVLLGCMDFTKVLVASTCVGLMDSAIQYSVERARSREQFGKNIGKFQAIQWKLADMSSESAASRLMTYRAAWSKDEAPEEFRKNAAMCKYYASRVAQVHSSEAVQIFGALGVSCDQPMEKFYRDSKVMEICEGTSEIQKNIVASEIGS